jgi:hypothetical protein
MRKQGYYKCCICKKEKHYSEFPIDRRRGVDRDFGVASRCKLCKKEYDKQRTKARKAYFSEYRDTYIDRRRAKESAYYALRKGDIQKHPCSICGSPDVVGHHKDYSQPLDVTWVCRKHHADLHYGNPARPVNERR